MAPPIHSTDDPPPPSSARSIYAFPPPPRAATLPAAPGASKAAPGGASTTAAATSTAMRPPAAFAAPRRAAPSPVPAAAASFLLRRRLLLPTLAAPALVLTVPALAASVLSAVAFCATPGSGSGEGLPHAVATSAAVLLSALALSRLGRGTIERHAPTEKARRKALAQSAYALPFWSLVASVGLVRALHRFLGALAPLLFDDGEVGAVVPRGRTAWIVDLVGATLSRSMGVAWACAGPASAWAVVALTVLCRYAGPFCPIVRCSSTPLRTNPFDAALARIGRNFTSRDRFLDAIAYGLDQLAAPSGPPPSAARPPADRTRQSTLFAAAPRTTNATKAATNATTEAANETNRQEPFKSDNGGGGVGKLLRGIVASSRARYSRPGVLPVLAQALIHAAGGHLLARAFVLPRLHGTDDAVIAIVVLSCALVPVFDLFAVLGAVEIDYGRCSSTGALAGAGDARGFRLRPAVVAMGKDVMLRVGRSIQVAFLAPVVAAATVWLWGRAGPWVPNEVLVIPPPSIPALLEALLVSCLAEAPLIVVAGIQDVLTRRAACARGLDVDVLLFRSRDALPPTKDKFLAEDLLVQSILMGDGATIDMVIAPPGAKSNKAFAGHRDEEIGRNERAAASFSEWIQNSSTWSSGTLADDVLRLSLLESLGGGGSADPTRRSFYFGGAGHAAAVRRRLDLSAAAASPGMQPIVVPVVRALCAFAGGLGDAMAEIYRILDKEKEGKPARGDGAPTELWKLPPGSLSAAEFAIVAAARLVATNAVATDGRGRLAVDPSRRHDRLSLLLPCILQSAYTLRSGMLARARATAKMSGVDLAKYGEGERGDGLGRFVAAECPALRPVISACDDAAKMALRVLVESGDSSLEDVLLRRRWKGDMKQWLVGLGCEEAPAAGVVDRN